MKRTIRLKSTTICVKRPDPVLVEFIGLPGSGKSTVSGKCQALLRRSGVSMQPLGKIARNQAAKMGDKNRFLRRYSGRNWLFGSLAFAQEHPEIYDLIFQSTRHDFHANLWAMDFLSQLYFAGQIDTRDMLVMVDEGFFHRGVAANFHENTPEKLEAYLKITPPCDVLVMFETPVETALERCRKRGRVPEIFHGETDVETLENFCKIGRAHV